MRAGWWAYALIVFLALERGVELWISRRNERWIKSRGGREYAGAHTRAVFLFHALWFIAFALEAWRRESIPLAGMPWTVFATACLQAARYWCIVSLGRFWNTKVLVLPGAAAVRHGPYRWFRHPNYLVVFVEIWLYPALFGCWSTAVCFGAADLFVLRTRIRREEAALSDNVRAAVFQGRR